MQIVLSDNKPFEVKRLGIFELDKFTPVELGEFTYKMSILGKEYDVQYDISKYENRPEKPDKAEHEIKEFTKEWENLQDWKLYQAALLHQEKRVKQLERYIEDVAQYILMECCIDNIDRIKVAEDWCKVYETALVPQLTFDLIVETLAQTYQAKFNGEDIFDALNKIKKKGHATYNTIRLWENKLMIDMQMTELEYSLLPLEERTRKVCAMFLDDIVSVLEMNKEDDTDGKVSFGQKTTKS